MIKPKQYDLIIKPVVTEKSTIIGEFNKYVFRVAKSATKNCIKNAIQNIFEVKVKKVNVINYSGKTKKFRGKIGKQNSFKKAIVTLEEGQSLDFAAEV